MNIITRIPPAYFIPIERDGDEPFRYLNAAKIESIDVDGNVVFIYLESGQKIVLTGDRARVFLNEIHQMTARYGRNEQTA
ncbi:hypothetical protein V0288_05270 [Pannus brasiliensis CCIBt3594]|uniref:Uncharacterized protein n=1 Tax=Pannus brasiliensis CCIBt3594 TaxID=1427578 RepID=A0AAW9QRB5_9CHRO